MMVVHHFNIEPTEEQEHKMFQTLGLCRRLYNAALEQRQIYYNQARISLTYSEVDRLLRRSCRACQQEGEISPGWPESLRA